MPCRAEAHWIFRPHPTEQRQILSSFASFLLLMPSNEAPILRFIVSFPSYSILKLRTGHCQSSGVLDGPIVIDGVMAS